MWNHDLSDQTWKYLFTGRGWRPASVKIRLWYRKWFGMEIKMNSCKNRYLKEKNPGLTSFSKLAHLPRLWNSEKLKSLTLSKRLVELEACTSRDRGIVKEILWIQKSIKHFSVQYKKWKSRRYPGDFWAKKIQEMGTKIQEISRRFPGDSHPESQNLFWDHRTGSQCMSHFRKYAD